MSPPSTSSYDSWTKEELIARLRELERSNTSTQQIAQPKKPFDFSLQPVRKIALKICYSGWEYNGLAFQEGPTPLPTVEEVLFNALARTRLVDPEGGLAKCGWERCGRTDRGVSAAGQVISVWVRTAVGAKKVAADQDDGEGADIELKSPRCPGTTELRYISMLNRVLPHPIRVLAWSPVSPTFSARFACNFRHYKYFFSTQGLDLSLMQDGANRLAGEHDFRNLCKLDPAKEITNFKRRVLQAKISVSNGGVVTDDSLAVFDLIGTAFLYHQVRHIMAILFLVGTGLEHPSVVSALLNVDAEHPIAPQEGDPPLEVVDRKPDYQMADALPLMLWDCGYADSDVKWQTDEGGELQPQSGNIYHQLQAAVARSVVYTALDTHFLAAAAKYHSTPPLCFPLTQTDGKGAMNVPLGGGTYKRTAKYVPLLRRTRLDDVETRNERWRVKNKNK